MTAAAAPAEAGASSVAAGASGLPTPGIARRMASFVYEGVLLFGVVVGVGLVYSPATGQRNALVGSAGLQAVVFAVLALYFVVFWTRGGQTLAMKTWHLRLQTRAGAPLRPVRALCRYLLAWLWFMPALATLHFSGLKGGWPALAVVLSGVAAYAALARLHPDRQFLHDAVCGTRIVRWQPPPRQKAP